MCPWKSVRFVYLIIWTHSHQVFYISNIQCIHIQYTYKNLYWISNIFCLKLRQLSPGVWNCVFVSFILCPLVVLVVSEELGPGASLHLGNCFPGKTLVWRGAILLFLDHFRHVYILRQTYAGERVQVCPRESWIGGAVESLHPVFTCPVAFTHSTCAELCL